MFSYHKYQEFESNFSSATSENMAAVVAQDESAFFKPQPQHAAFQPRNPDKNLYFGDLHVHTALSFDSYLFGNRLSIDEAYAFARGKMLKNSTGEVMQLSRPLDFVAITDHAESFWMMDICFGDIDLPETLMEFCSGLDRPSISWFYALRDFVSERPLKIHDSICSFIGNDCSMEEYTKLGQPVWEIIKVKAEQYNEPGRFTAFAAYEYSPPLSAEGKHHRNVIFRNKETTRYAFGAYEARTAPILWKMLESECEGVCDFLTIPHNMNKTWGLAYARQTIDGDPYTLDDWNRRARYEPLAEIFQIKGSSECAYGIGSTDEECAFEQFLPVCVEGESIGCISATSMARDGLKIGLRIEDELGINPLKYGFIGATDTHQSNPGDAEEYDFRGKHSNETPAIRRMNPTVKARSPMFRNPGGLAGVWAAENTRDALFNSMKRREVYATTGTRIRLRFFAGVGFSNEMIYSPDGISLAYSNGVPMGSELELQNDTEPSFMIIAQKDPMSVPLDRVQVIKGWSAGDEVHEKIIDIACSDGRMPDEHGRCKDLDVQVDLENCASENDKGAEQLSAVWQDPDYDHEVTAFYYIRVLEIPTCRWSSYDALRIDKERLPLVPASGRERAWSSPIWIRNTLY